ncbi:hypothetical protein BDB00DRAFT_32338 [Zychaea mexicana]|uniref:uncharacterized protein n=1 Tax=Zychaea mexicana TaxID=64656 RepID=UPI0022FE77A1|nr:uncharacterized protein BDB00DRAFT_32338 [Zychaea mexicana]KAI9488720.1 hypothetical protein BDB00DRAFT_32338 [Zychaea mexicana]
MAHFTAQPIKEDLAQLDHAIFETAHRNLRRDLTEFVHVFEESDHVKEDTLAAAYVQLTNCGQSLQTAKTREDDLQSAITQGNKVREDMNTLETVLQDVKHAYETKTPPFAVERAEFLKQLEKERQDHLKELRRQQDKIEEHYAKKTRESTYRNLVGSSFFYS